MSDTTKVGFLGAGRMATALAKGLIEGGVARAEDVVATDVLPAAREAFTTATGARTVEDAAAVLDAADTVVLAVKPQVMPGVLAEIAPLIAARHLVVSIAAGVTLRTLTESLGEATRIVRVMPNTPCLLGAGASAFALGAAATADDADRVRALLQTVGSAELVGEPLLDAVTGLSGSGPAYVYLMIEALADGGVRSGLPRPIAMSLAAQTVLGAARMVLETGEHPGALKDAVASPGGTTIAGLHALERGGLRGTLIDAVAAATERSRELGES